MLYKKNRLTRNNFKELKNRGKIIPGKIFNLRVARVIGNKFSVVTPSSTIKKSTERNLLKRRTYSILRENISRIYKNTWLVFYFKKNPTETKYHLLEKEVLDLLKRAEVLI